VLSKEERRRNKKMSKRGGRDLGLGSERVEKNEKKTHAT